MTELINGYKVNKSFQELPLWKGVKILDTYGNKPVLDYNGNPVFAELFALRIFNENGYDGVWVDSYRRLFRTELPERKEPKVIIPSFVQELLQKINPNGKLSGTWDLILWKNEVVKFVELKRKNKDNIRQTQIDFFIRAIDYGIPIDGFEIFEWSEKID